MHWLLSFSYWGGSDTTSSLEEVELDGGLRVKFDSARVILGSSVTGRVLVNASWSVDMPVTLTLHDDQAFADASLSTNSVTIPAGAIESSPFTVSAFAVPPPPEGGTLAAPPHSNGYSVTPSVSLGNAGSRSGRGAVLLVSKS